MAPPELPSLEPWTLMEEGREGVSPRPGAFKRIPASLLVGAAVAGKNCNHLRVEGVSTSFLTSVSSARAASALAPALTKRRAIAVWPQRAAKYRGVHPPCGGAARGRAVQIFRSPHSAAHCPLCPSLPSPQTSHTWVLYQVTPLHPAGPLLTRRASLQAAKAPPKGQPAASSPGGRMQNAEGSIYLADWRV